MLRRVSIAVFLLGLAFFLTEHLGFILIDRAYSFLVFGANLARVTDAITLFGQEFCRLFAIARFSRALPGIGVVIDLRVLFRILSQKQTANREHP